MPVKDILSTAKNKMDKAIEIFHEELKSVRTGQASTGLVENIKVNYYGTETPMKQLASLATPESNLIVIKPFDPGSVKQIEAAIKNSDLSIAPMVDGKLIRLNVPDLSEERRNQLEDLVKQEGEQAKVSVRNIRRDANKQLEKEEKGNVITEDDLHDGKKQIDDITRNHTEEIEKIAKQKSEEIQGD